MHARHEQVQALLQAVSREVILPYYQNLQQSEIEEKSPGDLVTIADRLSEEFLTSGLRAILPEAAIVGEEAAAADPGILGRLRGDMVWIIDPIDGTGNFAAGVPPFGVIIALVEGNETIAGWLYDPLTRRICHTVKGAGSYINGAGITVSSDPSALPVAALATGFMTGGQRKAIMKAAQPHYQIVDIPRCAAEQYPRLALGTNHISVFERTLPWDHAAGILFLQEAGGKVARWDGSAYRPADGRTGLLAASSPKLWDEAVGILGPIFQTEI